MRRSMWVSIGLAALFFSCAGHRKGVLEARVHKAAGGQALPYVMYYPPGKQAKPLPVFIWLHGAGERGDDNVSQLIHIVPYLASSIVQEKYPCVVVAPQCPREDYWAPIERNAWKIINGGQCTAPMQGVIDLIEKIKKDPNVDASRIYVGGLSMGGFGTLDLLSRKAEWIAAAVPVCGGADLEKAKRYAEVPLWVFHGAKDPVVPADFSRDLIRELEASGGHPKYTEYPEGGHNVWNDAIRDPGLLPWLFAQKKSVAFGPKGK
ncbi:MAG: dienelactone hydrolase family protein [Saprospiraceae bacterium]|nr:dienelactone hydrolase family protein [Saprospiraceae bacterium]